MRLFNRRLCIPLLQSVEGPGRQPWRESRRQRLLTVAFYAGPFGWISGGASEFAVAIRSALIRATPEVLCPQLGIKLGKKQTGLSK